MADNEEWSSNANEVVEIALVRPGPKGIEVVDSFAPGFTYPIFGEEETIFGYKNLKINLSFNAHDVRPNVEITYDDKFKPVGETEATNIEESLKPFLPASAFEDPATFKSNLLSNEHSWAFRPPGSLVNAYTVQGRTFQIWRASLTNRAAKEQLEGMQILVPLYIEGGTEVNLQDPDWTVERWNVFLVYEVLPAPSTPQSSNYCFVGYSTSYRIYLFTPPTPPLSPSGPTNSSHTDVDTGVIFPPQETSPISSFPSRERISQFLILPPYRGLSHGRHLYTTMVTSFLADPTCYEITVEDPNEAFDDLRDICDIQRLRRCAALDSVRINTSVSLKGKPRLPTSELLDTPLLEKIRRSQKIAPRQFARLVDMHLLSRIPPLHRNAARITRKDAAPNENDRAYYFWRLLVKQRLYKHNRDQLAQLDLPERKEKLEQTLVGVEADYLRLLRRAEQGMRDDEDEGGGAEGGDREGKGRGEISNGIGSVNGSRKKRGAKRVIEDDEDDEDVGGTATPAKKARGDDGT